MTPQQVLDHYGTKTRIAEVLGISVPSVIEWFYKGRVPTARQYHIHMATNGKLKADLPADRTKPPRRK